MSKFSNIKELLSPSSYSFINTEAKNIEIQKDIKVTKIRKIVILPSITLLKSQSIETSFSYLSQSDIQGHYFYPHLYEDFDEKFLPTSSELVIINEIKSPFFIDIWFMKNFTKILQNNEALEKPNFLI